MPAASIRPRSSSGCQLSGRGRRGSRQRAARTRVGGRDHPLEKREIYRHPRWELANATAGVRPPRLRVAGPRQTRGHLIGISHQREFQRLVTTVIGTKQTPRRSTISLEKSGEESGRHCGKMIPEFGDAFRL